MKWFVTALRTYEVTIESRWSWPHQYMLQVSYKTKRNAAWYIHVFRQFYGSEELAMDFLKNVYIKKKMEFDQSRFDSKQKVSELRKKSKTKMIDQIQVGTVLVNQRWREQSNVDCYQVIKKRGSKVWVRPIGTLHAGDTGNSMAEDVIPNPMSLDYIKSNPDNFTWSCLSEKLIGPHWVIFRHWACSVRDWKQTYYHSWYA